MTGGRRRWPRDARAGARRAGRAVATISALAAAAAILVGCAGAAEGEPSPPPAPQPVRTPGRADHAPSPGDCWQEPDYDVVRTWSWWQGSPPVDCADEHNSITAAVGELPADFPALWSGGERRDLSDEEWGVVHRVCTEGLGADIGLREGSRVTWFWYLPSPREWAAGERWLRCDVAVVALGPLSPMVVEPLPETVADVVDNAWHAFAYLLCLDTPHPAPDHKPWDDPDAAVAVPCDGQSQWHFGTDATFDGEVAPTQDQVLDRLEPYCAELVGLLPRRTGAVIYFPTEQTWAQGNRTATCWIY